uniref:C2H2-type domain-containing protein n=1 Tax=Glossina brevipalpis TaxID=37001 RepID=A0A1A9WGS9_9MUSC
MRNSMHQSAKELKQHIYFICPECGLVNKTQKEWRLHLNLVHEYVHKKTTDFNFHQIDQKCYECSVCMKVIHARQITRLQYHWFCHLPYPRTYSCRHCKKDFARKKTLYMHLHKTHGRLIFEFSQQHRESEDSVQDPRLNTEFYIRFLCPFCGKLFTRFQKWMQHINTGHSTTSKQLRVHRIDDTNNYYCGLCQLKLLNSPSKTQLQRHYFTHLPYQMYFQCAFCSIRKCYKTELLLHYIKIHSNKYPQANEYLKTPKEWGGEADVRTVIELKELLYNIREQKSADVIRDPLEEHLIKLEENTEKMKDLQQKTCVKNVHEFSEERILANLEQEVDDAPQKSDTNSLFLSNEICDEDLEEIYSKMFEEIDEEDSDGDDNDIDTGGDLMSSATAPMIIDQKSERLGPNFNAKVVKKLCHNDMQKFLNYLCPECGREFKDQIVWRNHVFTEHNLNNLILNDFSYSDVEETSYICLICSKTLSTKDFSLLKRHHFGHAPYKSYLKCKLCVERQSNKSKMFQHLQQSHANQIILEHACSICSKIFESKETLKEHYLQCTITEDRCFAVDVIEENMRILKHLENAGGRLRSMLLDMGKDPDMMLKPMKRL